MSAAKAMNPRGTERGFVLVGVVMFVLALTILGLSMFGLSSYEAQFMQRSYDSSQALFLAQGGIERAKFVVAKKRTLDDVQDESGYPAGVYFACAWQDLDSTGAVDPDKVVRIRIAAEIKGEQRMVEAQYRPAEVENLYKRLMTLHSGMELLTEDIDGNNLCQQTSLSGHIWEEVDDQADWACAQNNALTVTIGTCPIPEVDAFFSSYMGQAQDVPSEGPFNLTAPSGEVGFFRTVTADPDKAGYSVYVAEPSALGGDPDPVTINVSGVVVWMLDSGFRSNNFVQVQGGSDDCLVIVSKKNHDTATKEAVWFFGGVRSLQVPLILVSDEEVDIEHFNNRDGSGGKSTFVKYLSIFANHAYIRSPYYAGTMHLQHDPDADEDGADGVIDRLCEVGGLPNSSGLGMTFDRLAGTWKELDPNAPPPVN